jgi:phage terminase Nu1 subunit (DNA packaging protein)
MAQIFGVSHVTLRDWERNGMPSKSKGRRGVAAEYDTEDCINWKIGAELGEMQDPDDPKLDIEKERARLIREQADSHSLKNGVLRGNLLHVDVVVSVWANQIANAKSRLRGIRAKLRTRIPKLNLKELGIISDMIDQACNELAEMDAPDIRESLAASNTDMEGAPSADAE